MRAGASDAGRCRLSDAGQEVSIVLVSSSYSELLLFFSSMFVVGSLCSKLFGRNSGREDGKDGRKGHEGPCTG